MKKKAAIKRTKQPAASLRKPAKLQAPARTRSLHQSQPEASETWNMRLYIAGQSARSLAAIENLRRICDQYLPGRHSIEVVDLIRYPERARADQIVAIPTLVRKMPEPVRRIIGDLSLTEKVTVTLDLATN